MKGLSLLSDVAQMAVIEFLRLRGFPIGAEYRRPLALSQANCATVKIRHFHEQSGLVHPKCAPTCTFDGVRRMGDTTTVSNIRR
jgi:hypothetical protein